MVILGARGAESVFLGRLGFDALLPLILIGIGAWLLRRVWAGLGGWVGGTFPLARRLTLLLFLSAALVGAEVVAPEGRRAGNIAAELVMGLVAVGPLLVGARGMVLLERVLILGAGPLADRLLDEIRRQDPPRYHVLGLVDDAITGGAPPPSWLGGMADLGSLIARLHPDRIIVTLSARRGRLPLPVLLEARASGIAVENGVEAYERLTGKLAIEDLTPSSLVFCNDFNPSRSRRVLSRAVSLVGSTVGLLLSLPLLALTALLIVLDSPGPVFFLHDRMGLRGKCFRLIKFRTMHPSSHAPSEWEKDNGDRITRIGRLLRRFRLDELPQFINVLKGDMELVGPRPHPVSNVELFSRKIPFYGLRSSVRPGITGWAQIRYGYANSLEEETEKMRYDLFYIKHKSLLFDARILLQTIGVVLLGGAPKTPHRHAPFGHPKMAA